MSDLIEFLRARLDEDERIAQAAGGDQWPDSAHEMWDNPLAHARRHDPARALREVEANRRILDQIEVQFRPGDIFNGSQGTSEPPWLARMLALPYADHPEYRDEWAVTP